MSRSVGHQGQTPCISVNDYNKYFLLEESISISGTVGHLHVASFQSDPMAHATDVSLMMLQRHMGVQEHLLLSTV